MRQSSRRAPFAFAAFLIAALTFLPVANWIPGGASAPGYAQNLTDWIYGTAIALGVGYVLAISSSSRGLTWLWRDDAAARPIAFFSRRPLATSAAVALVALLVYALISRFVFNAHPLRGGRARRRALLAARAADGERDDERCERCDARKRQRAPLRMAEAPGTMHGAI